MSIAATDYVLNVAEDLTEPAQRFVLLALAARANGTCGCVFSGTWLRQFTGLHRTTVLRHVTALADLGYVELRTAPGRAHIVRFPLALVIHNPSHHCAGCREWKRRDPSHDARYPSHDATPPVASCDPNQEGNQEVNLARGTVTYGSSADVATVRQIWMDAREHTRRVEQGGIQ